MAHYDTSSPSSVAAAQKIARATQKPGQSKEQTQLIAQGIQKGIELYKKQQNAKARDSDRQKKRTAKAKAQTQEATSAATNHTAAIAPAAPRLPWILLCLSWLGFIAAWFGLNCPR
ncbi:MAG: DUF2956 domain-containing protein [Aeromonas sp.]